MVVRRFVGFTIAACLLIGCGPREDRAEPASLVAIEWETCGDVECATFGVPLDRVASPSSRSTLLELRAYRQISPKNGSRHLPLVIHPGGPGTDARAAVSRARTALAPIIDDFDIYALSTRGSVDGAAFDCGESLRDLRVIDTDSAAAGRFARGCRVRSPQLVGHAGTLDSVDDLEDFRRALGFGSVRFLGWSYGATLGAAWAMTRPSSLRSIVLDAPSDPRSPWDVVLVRKYDAASRAFARGAVSTSLDGPMTPRETALWRDYLLYEPKATDDISTLTSLRLGETPDGHNDGGIETQIGVHCSDVTRAETRAAIDVPEPDPRIGFGATFDRVCMELPPPSRPLSTIEVDSTSTRLDVMVVSTTGDHVIPASVSQELARAMLWRGVIVDANRHLSVGLDSVVTKKAMAFLATGD